MSANPPSTYRHYVGHVYLSGGHVNVDITARKVVNDRSVEVSAQRVRDGDTRRDSDTREVEVPPEVAQHFAAVLGAIDDWDELTALVKLLRDAAAYEGGSAS